MADPAAPTPAIPPDVAALLRTDGPGVIDAAAAAGIAPPPGAGVIPRAPRALLSDLPGGPGGAPVAAEVPAVHDPAAAFKAAVAAGLAANAPAAQPAGDPAPTPTLVVGAAAALAPTLPPARIVSSKPRSAAYELAWPVEYDGKLYTTVIRARPTSKEVGDYFERLMAQKDGDPDLRFPIFFDDAGAQVPEPVWDAMDDDDRTALLTGLDDFLPLRLQRLQASAPVASTPTTGADTGPTS